MKPGLTGWHDPRFPRQEPRVITARSSIPTQTPSVRENRPPPPASPGPAPAATSLNENPPGRKRPPPARRAGTNGTPSLTAASPEPRGGVCVSAPYAYQNSGMPSRGVFRNLSRTRPLRSSGLTPGRTRSEGQPRKRCSRRPPPHASSNCSARLNRIVEASPLVGGRGGKPGAPRPSRGGLTREEPAHAALTGPCTTTPDPLEPSM